MNVELYVPGIPEPKGSKHLARRGGKVWMLNGSDGKAHRRLEDWSHRVAHYGKATVSANAITEPCDAPMCVDVTFYMPRPKSVPLTRIHCSVKPDVDKLLRGVLDPLKGILITEDSRVVGGSFKKVYADDESPPGAHIRIWSVA